jgi:hypothetical protein
LAHPQLRQLRTCHSPSSNSAAPQPPLGGRAAGRLDGEIASTNDRTSGLWFEFGNDIPTGSLCYNTFLPFVGQMADRQGFEPAVILIIELPSGDADRP